MIPTFLGILIITFFVSRFQSGSLMDDMSSGGTGADAGSMNSETKVSNAQNYLSKFYRAGNHLPAVLNFRVFEDKSSVLDKIKTIERTSTLEEGERLRAEMEIWVSGRHFMPGLYGILLDDELKKYHGAVSEAMAMCGYYPTHSELFENDKQFTMVKGRNHKLKKLKIFYNNDKINGYQIVDTKEEYDRKRNALINIYENNKSDYVPNSYLYCFFFETGIIDIASKLLNGELYSEHHKEYVFTLIAKRWSVTFGLTFISIIISWLVSIPLGIRSARINGSLEDRITTQTLFLMWSTPQFFIGTLLLIHFCTNSSYGWQIFPNKDLHSDANTWYNSIEYLLDLIWHAFLPLIVLCYANFTVLSRYMKGQMLNELHSDYVRTARAKGVSEKAIVYKHSLRNSMVTMITLGSGLLAGLFGGFVFVESIFSIQGLGTLMLDAALNQDVPLIIGSTIISVLLLLVGILLADILYAVADPRIRNQYS